MTTLSSIQIAQITAAIVGADVKRAATKSDAIKRLRTVAANREIDADLVLAQPDFDTAIAVIRNEPAKPAAEPIKAPTLIAMAEAVEAGETIEMPEPVIAAKAPKERKARAPRTAEAGQKTKREIIIDMVTRPEGATELEICEAIGWKACLVTLRRVCEAEKITIVARKEEGSRRSRYFGTR